MSLSYTLYKKQATGPGLKAPGFFIFCYFSIIHELKQFNKCRFLLSTKYLSIESKNY
mgnify:CR=1 FL=1